MRKSKFTEEEQKKYAEEALQSSPQEVAKKIGVNPQTIYVWTKKWGINKTTSVTSSSSTVADSTPTASTTS